MDELRRELRHSSRHLVAAGPPSDASTPLTDKEAGARLAGEVLAFLGLLVLLVALFVWRHVSGYDFIRNGWIDLPSNAAAAWNYAAPKVSNVVPSEYRHDPHGAGAFMVVLLFVTFSAILRRRWILAGLIGCFCLVPWPAFGLRVQGTGFAVAMIIVAGLAIAIKRRDFPRVGIGLGVGVAVWTWFSLGVMILPNDMTRPAVRFAVVNTPGAIKLEPPLQGGKLNSMAGLAWPENMAGTRAYLVAQDAFFRGEPDVIAANLLLAKSAVGTDGYTGLRIAGLEQYLLSEGVGSPHAVSEYQSRRWRLATVTNVLLGLGAALIVIGLSLEWIAGAIKGRIGRLEVLREQIDATASRKPAAIKAPASSDDNIFAASLRRIRLRLRWALGIAAPFVIGGVALALLAFYLRVPSGHENDGFKTVHMLGPVFDNFPNGFDNVTANERMLLVAPTMWPYYLGVVVGLVLLGLRRFRLFLALVLLMTSGGQLGAFMFPRSGVVEIAASDFKPTTIQSIETTSRVSNPVSEPQRGRTLEAYHYTLAQLAYLAGDATRTAAELEAVGTLDFWAYPSVEWRLAIMRDWVAMRGIAVSGTDPAGEFVMIEEGRAVAAMIMRASLLLLLLGSPAIFLALVYLWRRRRIHELQDTHAQLSASRRTSNLFAHRK